MISSKSRRHMRPAISVSCAIGVFVAWSNLAVRIKNVEPVSLPFLAVPRTDEAYIAQLFAVLLVSMLLTPVCRRWDNAGRRALCLLCAAGSAFLSLGTCALLLVAQGAAQTVTMGLLCGLGYSFVFLSLIVVGGLLPAKTMVISALLGLVISVPLQAVVIALPVFLSYVYVGLLPLLFLALIFVEPLLGRGDGDGGSFSLLADCRGKFSFVRSAGSGIPVMATFGLICFAYAEAVGGIWSQFSSMTSDALIPNQVIQSLLATMISLAVLGVCMRSSDVSLLIPISPFLAGTAFLLMTVSRHPVVQLVSLACLQGSLICTFLIAFLMAPLHPAGRYVAGSKVMLVGSGMQLVGLFIGWALRSTFGYDNAVTSVAGILLVYLIMGYLLIVVYKKAQTYHVVDGKIASDEDMSCIRANILRLRCPEITDREEEILVLVIRGYGNAAIADRLSISENTVKTHVRHLFEKLHVDGRRRLIDEALSLKIDELK